MIMKLTTTTRILVEFVVVVKFNDKIFPKIRIRIVGGGLLLQNGYGTPPPTTATILIIVLLRKTKKKKKK